MSQLKHSFYDPARGRHAPGDLRVAFLDWLEEFLRTARHMPLPAAELRGAQLPFSKLAGLLWNCTDILPGDVRADLDDLGFAGNGTYSAAVRCLQRRYCTQGASVV
ncbi:hypothetical protein [Falsiroseomonas sp. HW251]|uniref:hypothetical protein n=1 Tax=Falsiroseomonas sp. HW251 TaxID=3390998 RepID=UPI003D311822